MAAGKVIYGVQAAGVFWINLSQVYDIAFREGETLAGARRRVISEGADSEGVNITVCDPEDWKIQDEYIEPRANKNSTAVVLIDEAEESRIMAMISKEDYLFPAAKKKGDEFILIDTRAGVICFNLLRQYDDINWSRTGSLRLGIQNRPLRVQGVGASGVARNIHFCENGENDLAMHTLVELGWSIQLATTSAELYHSDIYTVVRTSLMHGRYYVTKHDLSCLRIVEVRAAITREFDSLQLKTEDIPHLAIDHLLQLAKRNEEIQETAA